jgi:hypothetical protein
LGVRVFSKMLQALQPSSPCPWPRTAEVNSRFSYRNRGTCHWTRYAGSLIRFRRRLSRRMRLSVARTRSRAWTQTPFLAECTPGNPDPSTWSSGCPNGSSVTECCCRACTVPSHSSVFASGCSRIKAPECTKRTSRWLIRGIPGRRRTLTGRFCPVHKAYASSFLPWRSSGRKGVRPGGCCGRHHLVARGKLNRQEEKVASGKWQVTGDR